MITAITIMNGIIGRKIIRRYIANAIRLIPNTIRNAYHATVATPKQHRKNTFPNTSNILIFLS